MTRAARNGDAEEAATIDATFAPLWALFKAYGSLRLMYAIAERLSLPVGDPPLPLMRVGQDAVTTLDAALDRLGV